MAPYGKRSRIALPSIRATRSGRSAALPRHLKRRFSKAFQVSNCIRDVVGEPRYRLTITTAERSTVGSERRNTVKPEKSRWSSPASSARYPAPRLIEHLDLKARLLRVPLTDSFKFEDGLN